MTYYAIWQGTPDLMAVLIYTTPNLTQARRIVARMTAAGQAGYITTEQGCLMHEPIGEVLP
jgi:hypothetical protein